MSKECTIICITKGGCKLPPHKCNSISEAIRYADMLGTAYKIFIDGECVKQRRYQVKNKIKK